jgi:hypothetical protein
VVANCLQERNNKHLRVLRIGDPDRDIMSYYEIEQQRDFSILAEAVKKGTQLKDVTIECELPTVHIEDLLSALLRCATMEELRIHTGGTTGISFKEIEDMDGLVRDVRAPSSLRCMNLFNTPLSDAEPLFRILSQCPKLEHLCLQNTAIEQLDVVLTPFAKPSPCRLRRLVLYINPFEHQLVLGNNEDIEHIMISSVLQANPLLGQLCLSYSCAKLLPDALWHLQDMNLAGRVLLESDKTPQSLWATVIERVNHNDDWNEDRKASVIFDLLRGAARVFSYATE